MRIDDNDLILIALGLCLVALGALIVVDGIDTSKKHEQFNKECLKDHKQYECDVLWATVANKSNAGDALASGMVTGAVVSTMIISK